MSASLQLASDAAQGSPLGWVNYGVMGLLIAGLVSGIFWVKPAVDRLKDEVTNRTAERDKALVQRDEMAETFRKELLPALLKFLAVSEALLPLMQRVVDKTGGDQR